MQGEQDAVLAASLGLLVVVLADQVHDGVAELAAKYHDTGAEGGREHRLVVALHPSITEDPESKE